MIIIISLIPQNGENIHLIGWEVEIEMEEIILVVVLKLLSNYKTDRIITLLVLRQLER